MENNKEDMKLIEGLQTHLYGTSRTFADLILTKNKEASFKNVDEVMEWINIYFEEKRNNGDSIAILTVKIIFEILSSSAAFENNSLNLDYFRQKVFQKSEFDHELEKVYELYCKEKLINLIIYLNTYRKYKSVKEIKKDLCERTDLFKSSSMRVPGLTFFSPQNIDFMDHVIYGVLEDEWEKLSINGILDSHKVKDRLFNKHEKSLQSIGFSKTIETYYYSDGPCYPYVYYPFEVGSGPVYLEDDKGNMHRSCGYGGKVFDLPNYQESEILRKILYKDERYEPILPFYVPKDDLSLPIIRYGEIIEVAIDRKKELINKLLQLKHDRNYNSRKEIEKFISEIGLNK